MQRSVAPDEPFFLYFAPGGIHAPLQVPAPWIARYAGHFDQGWDRLREETAKMGGQAVYLVRDVVRPGEDRKLIGIAIRYVQ